MPQFSRNKIYIWVGGIALLVALGFVLAGFGGKSIEIGGGKKEARGKKVLSPLTGAECDGGGSRPLAVMLSSDKEARPLSGIGEADMVFEMPVVENGFTRMMAVYQCGRPKELGSVRSSRLDFVPLALGLHAIYAHFGGEHTVLAELNNGIIDNIDGLKYDGTSYYRKKNIPRPHNAFTNFSLIGQVISQLGYRTDESDVGYPHEGDSKSLGEAQPSALFSPDFQVNWIYNKEANSYARTRADKQEIDKNTGKQVEAKNIVVVHTTWSPINKDYIRVKTVGSGGLLVYKDGQVISGTWEKKDDHAKLYFYNVNHKEIPLAPGSTWVEIVTQ